MTLILSILLLHYISDFLLQTNWMAENKSKNLTALLSHVTAYSLVFTMAFGVQFGAITFATHLITDAITSRVNRALYYPVFKRYLFFAGIGLDQTIHYVTLFLTVNYLFGGIK